jgi:signal transduction histidine kinase/ActR/RegA family two-component response regulator
MKAASLKFSPAYGVLRCRAEQRLRVVRHAREEPQSVQDLRTAVEELRILDAELQIQNEELLESRRQIEESQKKYFRHFDLAPIGLIRLDHEAVILEANMLGAQMLEVNRLQLHAVPRPFLLHVAPDSVTTFQQHLACALASGKMETCELSLRSNAGHATFVRMQSVVSRSGRHKPDFYITLTDLTERREIEQKLEMQKVLAEAAVASKELFFGMLSHELRTPLTPLIALLEDLAADPRRSAEDLEAFAIMRRNLDLEIHLIDDLLDVTRITGGKLQLRREAIDVHPCLQQAIGICRAEIDVKGLQLTVALGALLHFVEADAGRLQQVFWNLIKNAVKFTPPGGHIGIETRCDQASNLIVEFRDTGIGVESWGLGRIFDPFFQIGHSLRQRTGGLGLGLAICKAITEAHGGTLTATSAGLNKGTTFHLELATVAEPHIEVRGPTTDATIEAAASARHEGLRLLLVEDHDDTREILARLLSRRGYHVERARDRKEACALASEKTFDLLVSDVALPDGTGCELLEELNGRHGLRGIAMSGFGSDVDLAQTRQAGFLEHLVKPIDATALDAAIQRFVGGTIQQKRNGCDQS